MQYPPPIAPVPLGPAPKRKSQAPIAIAILVIAVIGIGIGGIIIRDRKGGPAHPQDWDPRVLDLVSFAEDQRGLDFEHPVFVDFVTAEEYSDRTRTEQSGLSDEDKQQIEDASAQLRALGLADGSLDLFSASNDLADSGTLAFYDPETERVTVRGTELTVDVKVTLVHELVHVLQDQHFNIKADRFDKLATSGESEALRAMVEGDAVRIENEFIAGLSDADRATYQSANKDSSEGAKTQLKDVPAALQALQAAPYIYGPRLLELIKDKDGDEAINAALETPPSTEEQLVDPRAFFGKDGAKKVDEPALPDGVTESTDSGDFGA